jgi:hypothetical protein
MYVDKMISGYERMFGKKPSSNTTQLGRSTIGSTLHLLLAIGILVEMVIMMIDQKSRSGSSNRLLWSKLDLQECLG